MMIFATFKRSSKALLVFACFMFVVILVVQVIVYYMFWMEINVISKIIYSRLSNKHPIIMKLVKNKKVVFKILELKEKKEEVRSRHLDPHIILLDVLTGEIMVLVYMESVVPDMRVSNTNVVQILSSRIQYKNGLEFSDSLFWLSRPPLLVIL